MAETQNNPIADYEKHVAALEKIVTQMESGELSLDKALKEYEKGIALIRECQKALDAAEQKISILSQNSHGEETLEPFEENDTSSNA